MAPLTRLERATCGLGIRRSIHLSYRGADSKYRTLFFLRQVNLGDMGEPRREGKDGMNKTVCKTLKKPKGTVGKSPSKE
jgi:hypothetical protein